MIKSIKLLLFSGIVLFQANLFTASHNKGGLGGAFNMVMQAHKQAKALTEAEMRVRVSVPNLSDVPGEAVINQASVWTGFRQFFIDKMSDTGNKISQLGGIIYNGIASKVGQVYDVVQDFSEPKINQVSSVISNHPKKSIALGVVCMSQYYKKCWIDEIRAKITAPAASLSPDVNVRKKDFTWVKWRANAAVCNEQPSYSFPNAIAALNNDALFDNINQDIQAGYVFFTNQSAIKQGNNFLVDPLRNLLISINQEKTALYNDLVRLSQELVHDYSSTLTNIVSVQNPNFMDKVYGLYQKSLWLGDNYLLPTACYLKTIVKSEGSVTQAKLQTILFEVFNAHAPHNIGSLDELRILQQADVDLREEFVYKVARFGLLYSRSAARLYFDAAVAYGRLSALGQKVQHKIDTLNQAA